MGKWQINDFNNPSKEILFDLCMEDFGSLVSIENLHKEINREPFRDILVKYDLQSYTDLLKDYQIGWLYMQENLQEKRTQSDNSDKKLLSHSITVARILKMFLSREIANNNDLEIILGGQYKIDNVGTELSNYLKEAFIKEFERLGLNETLCTKEEAIQAIHNGEDDDWFFNNGFEIDEILANPESVTDEFIESYRSVHYRPREISLELVDNSVSELEMDKERKKGKAGAKIKNLATGELAKRISYIHRIKQFFNQNEYSSIKDYPLSNESCRFIYEYFEFWDLLSEHVRFDNTEREKRANYIKSLIRNNVNYFERGNFKDIRNYFIIIDTNLDLRIDLFKKVKDGLITLEEFYERMTSVQ